MKLLNVFRARLGVRLTAMFLGLALIPIAVVGIMSYQRASDSLTDLALAKQEQEATLTSQDMRTFLEQFSADVLALSDTPPVQAIIRARDNGGIDPAQ
ncbi:MAG: hypothetical protein ACE5Q6_10335, partial [Dehalococcoidia bacterium]